MPVFRIIALPFLMLLSMQSLVSCNMFRLDKRDDLSQYEITLEVDGKRYVIERTIQNWITFNWDSFQGASSGRRTDYGIFGQRIHDNQAIVIAFDYRRKSKPEDYTLLDDGTYVLSEPELLKHEFDIYLLDHYKDPQVIEMYDRIEAFNSPAARVKVIKKTYKKIPKIPFWPFQADGKDRYYDYDLSANTYTLKNARRNFEVASIQIREVSDQSIEEIYSEFPNLKNADSYQIENNYQGNRIYSLIGQESSCDEYACSFYPLEKNGSLWESASQVQKIYASQEIVGVHEINKQAYSINFRGKHQEIKRRKEHRDMYVNFKERELLIFNFGYLHTREHK